MVECLTSTDVIVHVHFSISLEYTILLPLVIYDHLANRVGSLSLHLINDECIVVCMDGWIDGCVKCLYPGNTVC